MTQTQFNLMLRVIYHRVAAGEKAEKVLNSYPRLGQMDLEMIRGELTKLLGGEKNGKN